MVNTASYVPVSYDANGVTTEFDFEFKILSDDDIVVTLEDGDGNQTTLNKTTDYNVSFTEGTNGGSITTVSTYDSPYKIIISRSRAYSQGVQLTTSEGFRAETVERLVADSLSMQVQQLSEELGRSLKKRVGQTGEVTIPSASEGKSLKWDSSGNLVNSTNDPDTVVAEAQTYASQAEDSANIAQAASGSIPSMSGNAGKYATVNETEDGWEYTEIETADEDFTYLTKQFLEFSDKKELTVKSGTKIRFETDVDVRHYNADTDTVLDVEALLDTGASLDVGKDYYVYLVKDGSGGAEIKVSLNSTYPDGYAADTSRKIGGFHTLCVDVGTISGHPLSDYSAGDILPQSVWCLTHRPVASPEGMVYIPETDSWVDIYLQSGTYTVATDTLTTASEYGATVTDTRAWADHAEDLFRASKRMLTDIEFSVAAEGSNQKTSITGGADPSPKTSGGHVDTASRRMISNYGVEECCGYRWQWLGESAPTGGSGWSNYDSLAGDKGQGLGTIYALLAGGSYGTGASSGSRSRKATNVRSDEDPVTGGRGASWTKAV